MSVAAHRIASYYRYLFRLPTFQGVMLRWFLSLSLILLTAALIQPDQALLRWLLGIPLLLGLPWLTKAAGSTNILFTPKRGLFLQYIQFLLMLGFLVMGVIVGGLLGWGRELAVILLGLGSSLVFVMVVAAGSLFARLWQAILYALTQTSILSLLIVNPLRMIVYLENKPLFSLGIIVLIALGVVFLFSLKDRGRKILRKDPLVLLQYFLQAWSEATPQRFEEWLEQLSEPTITTSHIIKFKGKGLNLFWVVPGVHPGPFALVGSHDLPARILSALEPRAKCVVFHGASEHDVNLPSQKEVWKYLEALKQGGEKVSDRGTFAGPIFGRQGGLRFSAFRVDKIAVVMLSYADKATDDIPSWLREKIVERAQRIGYNHVIIIDAHNMASGHEEGEESRRLSDGIEEALRYLLSQEAGRIRVAVGASRPHHFKDDIGLGGISITLMQGSARPSAFIVLDSNNVRPEVNELIEAICQRHFGDNFIVCTTDTHHNAARVLGPKGYVTAGDLTPVQHIYDEVRSLVEKVRTKFEDVTVEVEAVTVQLKVMGRDLLERGFIGLFKLVKFARYATYGLGLYSLLLMIVGLII